MRLSVLFKLWIEPKSNQIRPSVYITMPNEIKERISSFCVSKTEKKNVKVGTYLGLKVLKLNLNKIKLKRYKHENFLDNGNNIL